MKRVQIQEAEKSSKKQRQMISYANQCHYLMTNLKNRLSVQAPNFFNCDIQITQLSDQIPIFVFFGDQSSGKTSFLTSMIKQTMGMTLRCLLGHHVLLNFLLELILSIQKIIK